MKNYEEIYNPYIKPCRALSLKLDNAINLNQELRVDLEWLKLNNLDDLNHKVQVSFKKTETLRQEHEKVNKKISLIKQELHLLNQKIGSPFNPKYYFSNSQKLLKSKCKDLKISLNKLESTIDLSYTIELSGEYTSASCDKLRYLRLTSRSIIEEYEENGQIIAHLTQELNSMLNKRNVLSNKLQPITDELSRIDQEIEKVNSIIVQADTYDKRLSNARDSRERAIIHQECDRVLGNGKPNIVLKKNRELLKKYKRDLEKLSQRAKKLSSQATREIDAIIIDGNNMAYESDSFIGLNALIPATAILRADYNIIVVFDSEIRSMLKMSGQSISEQFDAAVKIHIVATKQKADETILDLASEKLNYYVISNDRFADYFDKEAVKNKRILRHEIIDNSIFIHDLDLKTKF